MTKVCIDTNILIYAVQKYDSKHIKAVDVIDQLSAKSEIVLSIQNIVEFSRVLTEKSKPPLDQEIVIQHIYQFLAFSELIKYSENEVIRALSISKDYEIHFFDALIVATMQENGISDILTENTRDFKKIPWLNVKNPFE